MSKTIGKSLMGLAACAVMSMSAGQAGAASVTVEDSVYGWAQDSHCAYTTTITFENLCTDVTGGGWLQVWGKGDFNNYCEYVRVYSDYGMQNEIFFGKWLNSDPTDDDFDGPSGDVGSEYQEVHSGTAYLSQSQVEQMVDGGDLKLTFMFRSEVNDLTYCKPGNPDEVIGARFHYEAGCGETPVIPTPAAAGMGLLSLGVLATRRRNK